MKSSIFQNPWVQIMIVLVAIVGGYIYYSQIKSTETASVPPKGASDSAFLKFQNMKFNFEALSATAIFGDLKTYGEYPVMPGGEGRDNIFTQ